MGIWGPGLYQNDVSDDVKSYFRDQLHRGKNAEQITQELMNSFWEEISDIDDRANFWLALADVQWDMGRLLPQVKEQALDCLSDGSAFLPWKDSTKKEITKRKQVLDKLTQKLNAPQPPEKKVSQYNLYKCPWTVGDVFAFPLESEKAKSLNLEGYWILLEKAGEIGWHPGHKIPAMYAKLFSGNAFPSTLEEYERLEYIRNFYMRFDLSLFDIPDPLDKSNDANRIRSIDENGYLSEYRFAMITQTKRVIPKNLIYVGNFAGAKRPAKDYVSQWEAEITAYVWKDLEEKMLRNYCNVPQGENSPRN